MLKLTMIGPNGRTLLGLGLSFRNLDKFYAEPGHTFIHVDGASMDLPIDVMIFSGETEAAMTEKMAQFIGPQTKVHVDPKLKS